MKPPFPATAAARPPSGRGLALLLCLLGAAATSRAQTQIAQESFDGTAGSIGFTTSVPQFDVLNSPDHNDFFSVQPNNGTKLVGGTITGGNGANMFAAEDIDTPQTPNPAVAAQQSITFNPVNIAGRSNVSLRLLLAAPGTGPVAGGTQNFYDFDANGVATDFVRVEASVDGGPFTRLIQFSPSTNLLNQPLSLDNDGNGLGGDGTALTAAFQEFILPVSNGSTVQARIVMHSNATNEYICVDNVRVFALTAATAGPVVAGVPTTPLVFTEGATAAPVAPALTVSDADSANLTQAVVTVSSGYVNGEDVLAATPTGAIVAGDIVFNPAAGTLTITRSASLATYQAVLRSVTYRNTNTTAPDTRPRQLQFRVSDGSNTSNQPLRDVTVVDAITSQAIPFTESFETDGRGTRYALDGRFTAAVDAFFDRVQPAGLTNIDGAFAVVGEDTATSPAPVKAVSFLLNAAGLNTVYATVRLGATGGDVFDDGDFLAVEASTAGLAGPWQTVGIFRSTVPFGGALALDTNGDGRGDGVRLSAALRDVVFVLPSSTTLGLRIRGATNTSGERFVIDRLNVTGSAVLNDLVASWDFNAAPVPALAVDSRAGLAARVLGGAALTPDAAGRSGLPGDRAMRFGTGAQRLHVPAPQAAYFTGVAAADRLSVSMWIRQTVRSATPFSLVAPSVTFGRGFQVHAPWNDQVIYFDTAGCCGATDTRLAVPTNGVAWTDWHHMAFVKNGSAKTTYLDGTQLGTGTNTGSLALTFTELFLGNSPTLGEAVDGDVDDVAIFSTALSPQDIAVLATQPTAALTVTANDTDGDTLPDKWERRFAPNLTTLVSAAADNDGDGLSNADEFTFGRNPLVSEALLVTTAANVGTGSLRDQLAAAATQVGPDVVRFDPAVFNGEPADTVVLASEIIVDDAYPVTVDATHRTGGVVVDAGAGTNRHFRIAPGTTAALTRLTLFGGNGTGSGFIANYGGAIFNDGTLTLTECTLRNNSAFAGGAIFNPPAASLTIQRSTLSANTASYGGAIQHEGASVLALTACTFAANTAQFEAGAVNVPFGRPIALDRCTVSGNAVTATGGLGVGGIRATAPSLFLVRDSIVSGNTDANSPGTPNLSPFSGLGTNYTGAVADLRLAPLGDYGGPTPTMTLRPGSVARNAAPGSTLTADQRGFAIVGTPDVGACEAGSTGNFNAWIWETLPNTVSAADAAPTADFDRDGATNENEWLALTIPNDPSSRFTPISTRSGGNVVISFPTVAGRTYTLWRSDNLTPGSWVDTGLPALAGNGSTRQFTVTITNPARRLYRVVIAP